MRGFLLDTNIISEFLKLTPSAAVVRFVGAQPSEVTFTADIVLAELQFGQETAEDPSKATQLAKWLADVRSRFNGRVVSSTEASFLRWRYIQRIGRRNRVTYSEPDTILAAAAQSHDLIVVTRDWKPFERVGAATVNPWKAVYRPGIGAAPMPINLKDPTLLAQIGRP
jgi:toxin FitB